MLYLIYRRRTLLLYFQRQRMLRLNKKHIEKKRRFWIRKLYQERNQKGEYQLLVRDLQLHDHEIFFRYFRMLPETFKILLKLVEPDINKVTTKMREPIGPDQRLAFTLRYLTTGDAHSTIGTNYRRYMLYLIYRRRTLLLYFQRQRMLRLNKKHIEKKRRFWIRRLYEERNQKGEYQLLVRDLQLHDHEIFFRYFRMLPETSSHFTIFDNW